MRDPARPRRICLSAALVAAGLAAGCGTTRWSDSTRTATEQLLTADAIERAVMKIDATPLAGRKVFLETMFLEGTNDRSYLTSTLRHHLLASGCRLAEKREEAEVIVEARAGAIGTDRDELLIGIPATSVSIAGTGTVIPEIAAAKRTDQEAVARVTLYAFHRTSGLPVWQSGEQRIASRTHDRWILGAGPFEDGDITDRPEFAGRRLGMPWKGGVEQASETDVAGAVDLSEPHVYRPPATPEAGRTPAVTADGRPTSLPPVR